MNKSGLNGPSISLASRQGPPNLNPKWHVERPRPIKFIQTSATLILIQGKPGQGKTVLAAELFHQATHHRCWLGLDASQDVLMAYLVQASSECRSILGEDADLADSKTSPAGSLEAQVDILVALFDQLSETLTFVIDNFDAFPPEHPSRHALIRLTENAPDHVRFILCSRSELVELKRRLTGHEGVIIDDKMLAFDVEEALRLNQTALPIDSNQAIAAWEYCDGWPILVNAARQSLLRVSDKQSVELQFSEHLRWGFDLVVQSMQENELAVLCRLSFFQHFNREQILEFDAASVLSRCGNLVLVDGHDTYCLQNDFRTYLNEVRRTTLSDQDVEGLFERSIQQSLEQERFVEVVDSLTQRQNVSGLDEFLRGYGNRLMPGDWPAAFRHCQKVDVAELEQHPWLALHTGRWMCETTPNAAATVLQDAMRQFVNQQDILGELLAITYFFENKLNIGRTSLLIDLYPRFKELAETVGSDLHPIDQIAMQIQLAGIEIYGLGDTQAANRALDAAQLLLVDYDLPDDEMMVHAFRSVDHLLHGRVDAARTTIEELNHFEAPMREDTRITVAFMHANYLPVIGETESLNYFINDAMEHLKSGVLEQRQTGGFLRLVQTQFLLFLGKYEEALSLLAQSANTHVFIVDGDVREQGQIVTALTYAALGNEAAARRHLQEFQHYSVTPAYRCRQMLNHAMTYVCLREYDTADQLLLQLISTDGTDNEFSGSACGIYAYSLHLQGKKKLALPFVQRWAQTVAQRSSSTLLTVGNTRECFAYLFKMALTSTDDAHLFLDHIDHLRGDFPDLSFSATYDLIPTLQITTGPQFDICLDGEPLNLTKSQKRLLLIVAFSPKQKISTSVLLDKIWPEEEGAENRLYTLSSRTRKVFAKAGVELADYLVISPGELSLSNTCLDIARFTSLLTRSESYGRSGFDSLSRLVRFTALDSWSGLLDPALEALVDLDEMQRHAVLTYQRTCVQLARTEAASSRNEAKLLQHLTVLFDAEPENISVASAVCRLRNLVGDGAGVYFAQQQFASGLAALDLPDADFAAQISLFETMSELSPS